VTPGVPRDLQAVLKTGGLSGVYVADSPMTRLAADVYALMGPWAELDDVNGFALRALVESVTKTFTDVDELVRDGVNGEPGWSSSLDTTRAPNEALGWLGQMLGVQLRSGESPTYLRQRVALPTGFRRGSTGGMQVAILPYLTGNKTVLFGERTGGSAYTISVRTRTAETPSTTPVLQALRDSKPAGVLLDYATFTGILFQESKANQATYTLSKAAKTTYTLRGA
jgi:hypothetical protein